MSAVFLICRGYVLCSVFSFRCLVSTLFKIIICVLLYRFLKYDQVIVIDGQGALH